MLLWSSFSLAFWAKNSLVLWATFYWLSELIFPGSVSYVFPDSHSYLSLVPWATVYPWFCELVFFLALWAKFSLVVLRVTVSVPWPSALAIPVSVSLFFPGSLSLFSLVLRTSSSAIPLPPAAYVTLWQIRFLPCKILHCHSAKANTCTTRPHTMQPLPKEHPKHDVQRRSTKTCIKCPCHENA